MTTRFECHIEVTDTPMTAVDLLAAETDLSRGKIKQIMQQGAVWLTVGNSTKRLRRAKKTLAAGQTLHLYYDADVLAQVPPPAELIADYGGYSVWKKPCQMLSQGSKWSDHCTLTRWSEKYLSPERPAFTVHRLDRATTGLMLIAHEKKMAAALAALFESRQIDKRYQAQVAGCLPQAELRVETGIDGRQAVSTFYELSYNPALNKSIVEARIETGRKHQIRRQLSELGLPITGDRLYGVATAETGDLQLYAVYLAFDCPINGERREFSLNTPLIKKQF